MPNTIINRRLVFNRGASKPPSTLLNNLVYLWPRNGNCIDVIGGNNGVDTNVTYGTGVNGQCGIYGGTGYSKLSYVITLTNFSFNFWVKRNVLNLRQFFFANSNSFGTNNSVSFSAQFSATNNLIATIVDNTITFQELTSPTTISDTNWHMITLTKVGTVAKLYVDAVLKVTQTVSVAVNNPSTIFTVGRTGDYNGFYFNGSVDETGYWNIGLTQAEITELLTKFYPY